MFWGLSCLRHSRFEVQAKVFEVFKVSGCPKTLSESEAQLAYRTKLSTLTGYTEQNSTVSGRIISRLHPITTYTWIPCNSSLHEAELRDTHNTENNFNPQNSLCVHCTINHQFIKISMNQSNCHFSFLFLFIKHFCPHCYNCCLSGKFTDWVKPLWGSVKKPVVSINIIMHASFTYQILWICFGNNPCGKVTQTFSPTFIG